MTLTHIAARLGDTSAAFAQYFGAPNLLAPNGIGIVRRYRNGRQTLTVLFDHNCASAVASRFAPLARPPGWLEPADLYPPQIEPRVLLCDGGWVAATQTCPLGAIRLIAPLP